MEKWDREPATVRPACPPAGGSQAILAEITEEVGDGVYRWEKFAGQGRSQGEATEMNESTGIAVGTRVVLHKAGSTFYFFFPIETC